MSERWLRRLERSWTWLPWVVAGAIGVGALLEVQHLAQALAARL